MADRSIEASHREEHAPYSSEGGARNVAWVVLAFGLLALGLYILFDFLRALVWAVVLAIALWPLLARAQRRFPPGKHNIVLPALFTALVAIVFLLPVVALAVEAVREAHDILDYAREVEKSGIPVPDFVAHLPYGAQAVTDWWNASLAHAGWSHELAERLNTSSNRDLTKTVGSNVVHRVVLFCFALLTLFFLFRDGPALIEQCLTASHRLFGPRGERVARQIVASVHGTVDGLVLVGIGEGFLLGIVYWFSGVPHPILFGAVTAVAATIPFGAPLAFGLAALLLVANGSLVPAIVVVASGFIVTFVADHFVRPALIGGTTRLPFLWVLLGILGGVETFGLLGLFVGPAVMAALILLWREFTEDVPDQELDRWILTYAKPQWLKVARIVGDVVVNHGNVYRGDGTDIAERIEALVASGLLEAQGDLKQWRHSEIRWPPPLCGPDLPPRRADAPDAGKAG